MSKILKSAAGGLAVSAALTFVCGTAWADPTQPQGASVIPVQCGPTTYTVAVNGGGNTDRQTFNPAHDIYSTSVLIPISFGEFTGSYTVTAPDGSVLDSGTVDQLPSTKGSGQSPTNATLLDCSYSFSQSQTNKKGVTFTFEGSGTVTGWIPAQH